MFKKIHLGLKDLPGYGPHPGTDFLCILILTGGVAGAGNGGWMGFWMGAIFFFVVFFPFYLMGAWSRGNDWLKSKYNTGDCS